MTSRLPDVHTIYLSPTGKRCMFAPSVKQTQWLFFRYLDNAELMGEGFPLSYANFRLMRLHPQQRWRPVDAATR